MKRRTRSGLATLAALCAVVALPGTATADPGDLPSYRAAEDAEETKGAASSSDGPRLEPGGTYTDTLEPGETKYWTVELDAKSSAWLSAVAQPASGSSVDLREGLSLVLQDTDGTECDSSESRFGNDDAARPLSQNVSRVITPDGECQDSGVYNLSVERTDYGSGPSAWPVELRFMREPGLRGSVPTTPPENDDLPTAPPDPPTGEAREIEGGTGFNDAPAMDEGVWKDRLRPGETRFYRVPVDWGRQLGLRAEFGTAKTNDDVAYVGSGVSVDLYNPARGQVTSQSDGYGAEDPAAVPVLAAPVSYDNRFSYVDEVAGSAFAGWYYVAVHAQSELADFVEGTVPVTLRTVLDGKTTKGPDYDGDAVAAGFGISDEDRDQASEGLTPQAAERSDTLQLVAFGGIGTGTVLLAGLAVWVLVVSRRAAAGAAAAGPVPQQYGPPYGGQAPHDQQTLDGGRHGYGYPPDS